MIEKSANLKVPSLGEVTVFYTNIGLSGLYLWQTPASNCNMEKFPWPGLQERLNKYFEGMQVSFDYPLDLSWAPDFTAKVLLAAAAIPYGKVVSYGQLALTLGNPGSARAVGRALSANRLPIVIPCHRVVCSNGKIGGFSAPGGSTQKLRLLEMEKNSGEAV